MACQRHDFKAAQPKSRFCQTARKRISEASSNLKNATGVLETKRAAYEAAGSKKAKKKAKQALSFAQRTYARWYTAKRASKTMYCRLCSICEKK